MKLFRELSEEETAKFQKWARDNYVPFSPIKGVWHPVVQAECVKINASSELNLSAAGFYAAAE